MPADSPTMLIKASVIAVISCLSIAAPSSAQDVSLSTGQFGVAQGSSSDCDDFPPHAGRPSPKLWCAYANASGSDEVWQYRRAAKKLRVTLFVGYPVPSPASAEVDAEYGMKGIYILRSQAARVGDYGLDQ